MKAVGMREDDIIIAEETVWWTNEVNEKNDYMDAITLL